MAGITKNSGGQMVTRPLRRRVLEDYFPLVTKAFPGYVKMACFRSKLAELIVAASATEDTREFMLIGVDAIDWRPEDMIAKLQKELYANSREYAAAAVVDPAMQIVGGKVTKKVSGWAVKGLDKVAANPKVSAKLGKTLGVLKKDHEWGKIIDKEYTVFTKKVKVKSNVFELNGVEAVTGHVVDYVSSGIGNKVDDKTGFHLPQGVDVSLCNETTQEWIERFGVPEKVAVFALGTADFLSDLFPPASLYKSIEGFFANMSMAKMYRDQAKSMEETKSFFDEKWKEFTKKLKELIKSDLQSLNDEDFASLSDLLLH